ncbi:MAG: NADH-quinone oxidoreductase subunit J [Clostridiaceae bacterium]|nr:NADH-quinone oxidoreductase subunit J [Eubacteriales bacterium]
MNQTVLIVLLGGFVISAVICALIRSLVKAAVVLALTSALLSAAMFLMGAPLAAVFELSVCAGLITVVFISSVSMTRVHSEEVLAEKKKERRKRFLPLIAVVIGLFVIVLAVLWPRVTEFVPAVTVINGSSAQQVLWDKRQTDLVGQVAIILTGVFGVLVFFKEDEAK